jgi:hypothetical protein
VSKNPVPLEKYYQPLTVKDSAGNEYVCLNEYEAKAIRNLIKTLQNLKIEGVQFDTGDWYHDIPYKIDKWLKDEP